MRCPNVSTPLFGMIRIRAAFLMRRLFPVWALLLIWGIRPETTHTAQAQQRPECIVVSHAASDTMQYAQNIWTQIARATAGIDVSGIANAWLYRPLFAVRYESDSQTLHVRIEEVQESKRNPAVYPIDLTLEAGALGTTERFEVTLNERVEEFSLPFPYRPRFVAVYPEEQLLMESRTSQPAAGWIAQLRHASFPAARLVAAQALRSLPPDPALILGLRTSFGEEPETRVRAAIVQAMAHLASGGAADRALAAAYEDASPEVRNIVFASLNQTLSSPALIALALRAAQTDPDQSVQAEAVRALAKMRASDALQVARSALITPSRNEVIRIAGLDALGMLHAYAHGNEPETDEEETQAAIDSEQATEENISPKILGEALTEGLRFAEMTYPLRLRSAARRLFLRIRQKEPAATYGAPPYLRDLRTCP